MPLKGLQTSGRGTNEKFTSELLRILPQTDQLNQLYLRGQICRVTRRACTLQISSKSFQCIASTAWSEWRSIWTLERPSICSCAKKGRDRGATEISFSMAGRLRGRNCLFATRWTIQWWNTTCQLHKKISYRINFLYYNFNVTYRLTLT